MPPAYSSEEVYLINNGTKLQDYIYMRKLMESLNCEIERLSPYTTQVPHTAIAFGVY